MIAFGLRFAVIFLVGTFLAAAAHAQSYAPLAFPDRPVEQASDLAIGTAFGKPPGDGPFPALVLLESCSGATADFRRWGQDAMTKGYVVMTVDSMASRGATPRNCNLPLYVRIADALSARARLEAFPFVDKTRIGLMGFSVGGHAALLVTADGVERANLANAPAGTPPFRPFAAAATLYAPCVGRTPTGMHDAYDGATGLNEPLLAQFGDADTQARTGECLPQFERIKATGADIQWVVYPGVTHCFDCAGQNGTNAVDTIHGGSLPFRYDAKATQEAEQRVFDFFAAKMKGGT